MKLLLDQNLSFHFLDHRGPGKHLSRTAVEVENIGFFKLKVSAVGAGTHKKVPWVVLSGFDIHDASILMWDDLRQ